MRQFPASVSVVSARRKANFLLCGSARRSGVFEFSPIAWVLPAVNDDHIPRFTPAQTGNLLEVG